MKAQLNFLRTCAIVTLPSRRTLFAVQLSLIPTLEAVISCAPHRLVLAPVR